MMNIPSLHLGDGPISVEHAPIYEKSAATEACNTIGWALMKVGYIRGCNSE